MFEDFPLIYAFSNRACGNMSLRYGDTKDTLKHRKNFLEGLGIDYQNLVCAKQIHSGQVTYVKPKDLGCGALNYDTGISDTDAFITDYKNVPLAIFTADCLSIFLYDAQKPAIGLVHAGWRSSRCQVVIRTIKLMQKNFKSLSQDLKVLFGPAIRKCCYEVGPEFCNIFGDFVTQNQEKYYLDLLAINKKQLRDCGIEEKNIFDCGICTSCKNQDFFSYRKDGPQTGRMMSVVCLTTDVHR